MHRIIVFFLTAALIMNLSAVELSARQQDEGKPVIVEDNYFPSDVYRIIQSRGGCEKLTIYGKERHRQMVQSTKEALSLPLYLDTGKIDGEFLLPSEVDGIVMDIPYNYYSPLDASAKYFYTLLRNGWEIEYYNSGSLCVQAGLIKEGVTCRLLIYENYLKVYCKLL